jgi:hypothetical protein
MTEYINAATRPRQQRGIQNFNIGLDAAAQSTSDREAENNLADFRFARAVERLHRLGPRALFELLTELGRDHLIRTPIERLVENI